ncbi:hypothetical protein [Hydrogenobacter hydrogenophilus]|uniref:hypothetical protein n=1 Tax=Hydrogenobacter hydrogenophilus TaxID=35835 RepID=UPI0015DE44D1|nr:hypothetical protein [Hydrogenobacter hydrogenophilus]
MWVLILQRSRLLCIDTNTLTTQIDWCYYSDNPGNQCGLPWLRSYLFSFLMN